MDKITIEKVTDADKLEEVFKIRRIVFVNEQNCPPELEWEFEEESVHFIALFNGQPAGAARWRKTDKGFKLERFAVLKSFRDKGVGMALVAGVLKDLPDEASPVYLNAQITAINLYKKFGFVQEGNLFEEAGIQHYKMTLQK